MTTPLQHKVISKIKNLSDNYHKLSLLSYELSRSMGVKCDRENMTDKEFKEYFGSCKLGDKINSFEDMLK